MKLFLKHSPRLLAGGAIAASGAAATFITGCTAAAQAPGVARPAKAQTLRLEAEAAQLTGPSVQKQRAGFSGNGYISGLTKDGDKLVWTLPNARAGVYEARLRYSSPQGEKGTDLVVNGARVSAMLPRTGESFASASAGKIELRDGENTLAIEKGWGYYDVDALDLIPANAVAALKPVSARLVDPQASPEARALMASLVKNYGQKTLSGQYEAKENDYIRTVTGQTPALLGGDLMEYSPSRVENGAKPEGTAEGLIQAARAGQIITLSWHWNAPTDLINKTYTDAAGKSIEAPWWRGFYTDATTFDFQKALDDPKSANYQLLLRDIDAMATQLKKFSDAGVPVLWRPLHEAEGGWFWWGSKGPDAFKKLWRLTYDRLSKKHDLHNLIWVYTAGNKADWYPGDDVVDIVGADAYPTDFTDPLSQTYEELKTRFDGRKLIALSEVGKVPDIEKMRRFGVNWSYFVSWSGGLGPQQVPKEALSRTYQSPNVINSAKPRVSSQPAAVQLTALQEAVPAPLAPAMLAPTALNYRALQSQTEANLRSQILDQWFPRAVSREYGGGFDQNFSENWTNTSKGERSIVYQARLTWLASQATLRFPAESAKWKAIAAHGADFLRTQMWDAQNGGFYWEKVANVPTRAGEKHVYGNAFAIYALVAHFQATGDRRSLELAKTAFGWLDSHARDLKYGGYFEALTRQGSPILAPTDVTSDFIGTRYGFKSMNTHIHLLEAFTALYEIAPDKKLKSRLNQVFKLVRDTLVVSPPGALNLQFQPNWKPLPIDDSFGHDIETAFLLTEAAGALGMPDDAKTWAVARELVDHVLEIGLDPTNGGFYDAGQVFGNVTYLSISNANKVWWVQAEALNSLLLMHEKYGAQTPRYWNAFQAQWNWIQAHQIDKIHGGWLASVSPTGAATPDAVKSDGWTEGYHQGRAMLGVSATLGHLAKIADTRR